MSEPADDYREAASRLRGACLDAWHLIDQLGSHASAGHKLDVLQGPAFVTAAFNVRAALALTSHLQL